MAVSPELDEGRRLLCHPEPLPATLRLSKGARDTAPYDSAQGKLMLRQAQHGAYILSGLSKGGRRVSPPPLGDAREQILRYRSE